MTTAATRVITDVYDKSADGFDIQLMYMPMNSEEFQNDGFSEVLGTLIPFTCFVIANIGARLIDEAADTHESML